MGVALHHETPSLVGQCTLFDALPQSDPIQCQNCWGQDMWTQEDHQEMSV